ncbi:bifunctional D-glycero-beta-D-manno-heptose-7-phosphate kinase/D-glycero-beta-D-manno-heptose 1-phosphate adenylyltransferase HldE [Pleionea sp. CnH1-48]|uniref:bifunctional D-glycero-beta-D-manno-heptose-7-phosphate kinase/D-glycero-beta-D-manno-heptose 1-phosphate adenylyltransferase HldE n=1 Tax=Pleionea sp. CnH1-48 TaxID=2954494 RepID=UPI002096D16E|nr:bifunctional D-glycero-beta-D-manno-heptose-7-phosphate kinase/D-glycero-beta-D-manno-heptose 1-phosphate adenylyltransferase HldE [Pleionea sp. CnH1-48]MCO7224630.1 bifunctional D-glycero-beta-D-manno-heptose-7-phosphate kinase/D-glycero-beta-D-manno-heptose 1-phosphate adenylyltransferase HldE [Pleionea sp. CnH1-48]
MKIHFPDFSEGKVLVVGDLMLDRYWHGGTSRISPEAPVPVVKISHNEERPGGAGNVALNLATLGCQVSLLGITGQDEAGQALSSKLTAANVDCQFIAVEETPTITKLRIISRQQQLIRLDFEEPFIEQGQNRLKQAFAKIYSDYDAIVLSDYAKGTLAEVEALIEMAREQQIPVIVDPKGSDFARYKGAFLMTPNLAEFEQIVGHCADESILVERGQALMSELELGALLITRGEQGMTLIRPGATELHLPAQAHEVYDVTGAGDTVIATLSGAVAAGDDLPSAVALANIAAGVVVGKLGTASISSLELRRKVAGDDSLGRGVLTEDQLQFVVQEAREENQKVVMTNGCFDILHAGHVAYLQEARALGDKLIVAVNDDASVARLKGDGRPVNPVERRMAVLAALGCVDWVVRFGEDTPERLISEILPHILVKGGDYKVEEIAGGRQVMEAGGDVKILKFVDGVSTTKIIEDLKK